MALRRVALVLAMACALVLAVGCGDDEYPSDVEVQQDSASDSSDDTLTGDGVGELDTVTHDQVQVDDNGATDGEVAADTESDAADVDLDAGDVADTADVAQAELPGNIGTIDEALDDDFLVPNRGLAMKMITPLLASYPSDTLTAAENPWVLSAELVLSSGEKVRLESVQDAFAALYPMDGYDDSWIFINADGIDAAERYFYALNLYPTLSTLQWMKDNDVGEISGDYANFVVYRSGMFNDAMVTCPAMVSTAGSQSAMRVHLDDDSLTAGGPFGFMINSYVTDDRDEIMALYQVSDFQSLCNCWDIVGDQYSARDCTADDIDDFPGVARVVGPADGAEGIDVDYADGLQWTSTGDPDGGQVSYDVYFGTDRDSLDPITLATTATNIDPMPQLDADTTYFWRVDVRDDEGNVVRGNTWSFNTDTEVPVLGNHNYLVLIDRRLEGQIDDQIVQYVSDIQAQSGLTVAVRYWMPGDHVMMRDMILDSYTNKCVAPGNCLVGVFMIGDLPSAWFEEDCDYGDGSEPTHEEFPTELYFQDMDGTDGWKDNDGDGIFDEYPGVDLEIFTSRLTGTAAEIRAYLDRVHDYRTNGSFFEPRNFFSFVDDDWNGYNYNDGKPDPTTTGLDWDLGDIYGENYIRREWQDNTDKSDYMDVMAAGGAEFVYQWIHADPQRLYFDDNFSVNPDNILAIDEINSADIRGSFFNLFDCSISRYTEEFGNVAGAYINSSRGLATIGSTKTGGIFNPGVLHGALADGEGFGEALRLWFNDTWTYRATYGMTADYFNAWWLGMMVQGDPLVLLNPNAARSFARKAGIGVGPSGTRVYSSDELSRLGSIVRRRGAQVRVGTFEQYRRSR